MSTNNVTRYIVYIPMELRNCTLVSIKQIDIEHMGVNGSIDVPGAQLPLPGIVHTGLPYGPLGHGNNQNRCPTVHVVKVTFLIRELTYKHVDKKVVHYIYIQSYMSKTVEYH